MKWKFSYRVLWVIYLLLPFAFPAKAQKTISDSLERQLANSLHSAEVRMNVLRELTTHYLTVDIRKSKDYAIQGLTLAEKLHRHESICQFHRLLGLAYSMNAQYDSALMFSKKSAAEAHDAGNEYLEALAGLTTANTLTRLGKFNEGLQTYFQIIPVFEKKGDLRSKERALGSVAALFMYQHNFNHAEKYYQEYLKMAQQMNDSSGMAVALDGLSHIFYERAQYDRALDLAQKAAGLFHRTNQSAYESVSVQVLARTCLKLRQVEAASAYAQQSLELASKQNISRYKADAMGMYAEVLQAQKKFDSCRYQALYALSTDSSDIDLRSRMYRLLVESGIALNDTSLAAGYFQKYVHTLERMASENYQKSLSELEVNYETEKKELQIASMLRERKLGITLSILGAVLTLVSIGFLINRQRAIRHKKLIAEQKILQLEQEKQLVATQAILDGETSERTRLARDLHDGLGGMLSVIKLNLYEVKKNLILEAEDVQRFNHALNMLNDSVGELRRVAHNMMPEALSRFGLKTSLQDFVHNIPNARFHYFGEDQRLNPKLEIIVYRTAYELVNNALKHAKASMINVQLVQHPDTVSLTVQDDGTGFDAQRKQDGNGLSNIQNRVASFNGQMSIFSAPNQGTEITVEFKIPPET